MSAPKAVLNVLREQIGAVTSEIDDSQLDYLASMCGDFCAQGNFDAEEWAEAVGPILGEWLEDEAAVTQVCAEVIKRLDPALAVKPVQGDGESEVRVGDKCEGKFYEDEQWYAVEVMGVTGPDAFDVCFLEYGNVETVTRSELRNVPLHAAAVVAPVVVPEVAVAELNFREMSMKDRVLLHMEQMHLGFMSGRMLLVKTDLHLERGHRYGLVGQNGAGKTTLMRRIAKKDMPSFPVSLNVVFVEHEIAGDQVNKTVTEFMMAAGARQGIADLDEERARSILATVGFGEDKRTSSVKELSGGWRMRLAIAQALLSDADILCLDEPTNHLDVHAVAWLEKFLSGLNDVCVVVVSHDPSFLDAVITDVVLIKEQQLNTFHGNFTDFTQQQSHFTMEDLKSSNAGTGKSTLTFRFPEPEKLIGVASTRAILKMAGVNFAYGAKKAPVLSDVEAKLMLVSRVAVLGENGAGKSTLVHNFVCYFACAYCCACICVSLYVYVCVCVCVCVCVYIP
jgi:ABC-type multidrug transport system ATPase subunit